ncbi:uncharacterized protein LOC113777489 isoform X1 [Coffea eugenioides]|uniref:Uncharacterized protein isoform X1 n=1 Tax=Coffea arabica TaxID=13443 RepID=A0A6P6TJ58_COFAR|nr:uncharacterized protein LOC113701226 isoform X1 [Coffea arabica]XP_027178395.1 uncharacterized protein LOC113777489 isoform X1 [Coffea eugenioides]
MQVIPRWRSILILRNSVIQSTAIASTSRTQLADFHSTTVSLERWNNKWPSAGKKTPDVRSGQKPSKDYIKYKIRQKRADTKKALKSLLFNSGASSSVFEETFAETDTTWDVDEEEPLDKKDQSKSSHAARRAARAHHRRMKRKLRRERKHDDVDDPENIFQASFGKRWCSWYFWREPSYQSSTTGFDFREHSNWSSRRPRESDIESEAESDTEPCIDSTNSDRKVLGLPLKGPLQIQDVKNAFRLSALKWHPDKHQGPSQVAAEEKFKQCVDAYKSLCSSLSTA